MRTARRAEEPLFKIAARRAARRVRSEAVTPDFGRLLVFQASGAAGDALIALALAGSLFFSVPEATARGRVGLYLLITVAPFAVVAPLLSRVLDRHRGSLRAAMVVAAVGRGTLAWLLSTRLETLLLFPIAFGLLVLSRAALIIRGAALPGLVPGGQVLVDANASLSRASAAAGMLAVPIGLVLVRTLGAGAELLLTAAVFYAGALPALLLPSVRGRRPLSETMGARRAARSLTVRQAVVAVGGMRLLVGFLVFHLAFAMRREDFGTLDLGLLVGGAAFGAFAGAMLAPRARRRLREEGILAAVLAAAGWVAIVAGRWFSLGTAVALVFVFGIASGAAKVAFDAIVQRETPEGGRGWAFARFESRLQLAWVAGAGVPLLVPVSSSAGVVAAGLIANAVAMVFVVARGRARRRGVR